VKVIEKSELTRELMSQFKRLHHLFHQDMHLSLETNLNASSLFVLMKLHRAKRNGIESFRVSALADLLGVSVPAVTQSITALEKSGLVRRDMDPGDRRAILVSITPEGEAALLPAMRRLEDHFSRLIEHLGEEDAVRLCGYLAETERFFTEMLSDAEPGSAPDGDKPRER
jgi:DNA-binding MarR family transcriptional regulator